MQVPAAVEGQQKLAKIAFKITHSDQQSQ